MLKRKTFKELVFLLKLPSSHMFLYGNNTFLNRTFFCYQSSMKQHYEHHRGLSGTVGEVIHHTDTVAVIAAHVRPTGLKTHICLGLRILQAEIPQGARGEETSLNKTTLEERGS